MKGIQTASPNWAARFLLGVILVSAFAIRYRGISYGLPAITRQDEILIMNVAIRMVRNSDANPHFFIYPSLFLYMQAGLLQAELAYGRFSGSFHSLQDADMSSIFLAGRFLTLFLSLATLLTVYFIGKLLFHRGAGIAAVLILAFSPLHVANSVYNSVDSPMTFWVTLAFLPAALIHQRGPKWRYYVLGAVFAGFAVGTKYNAAIIVLPLLLAHFQAYSFSWAAIGQRKLLIAALLAALAFFATTPYALLSFGEFTAGIRYFTGHYSEGHLGATAPLVSYPQYARLLGQGFGTWFVLCALGAAMHLVARERRKGVLLVAYPFTFFLMIGMYRAYFSRNLLSLTPFLALLAGYGIMQTAMFLQRTVKLPAAGGLRACVPPGKRMAAIAALLAVAWSVACLFQQGQRSYRHVSETTRIDTRLEAERWIEANLPGMAMIVREKYTPRLQRRQFRVKRVQFGLPRMKRAELERFDYVITSSHTYDRYFRDRKTYGKYAAFYEDLFTRYECIRTFAPDGQRFTGPTVKVLRRAKRGAGKEGA
jgi:hypothetical protein